MMLRPDFTVPVVQAHMAHGADRRATAYLGEVFRKQDAPRPAPSEYLQVGFEVFDRAAPEAADAEVFALFPDLLAGLNLRPVTGDIGILMAAVRGLETTDAAQGCPAASCLAARIGSARCWTGSPGARRFRARVRAAGPAGDGNARGADRRGGNLRRPAQPGRDRGPGRGVGGRCRDPADHGDRGGAALRSSVAGGPRRRRPWRICAGSPRCCRPSARRWTALPRGWTALAARGVDVATLPFEASHGRTALEYYDGFVFSFQRRTGCPPSPAAGAMTP